MPIPPDNNVVINASKQTDWFMPAVEYSGSVGECLDEVLKDLSEKQAFLFAVKSRISIPEMKIDSISNLIQKAKALESTLKVRLGMLNPEREGSWFRILSSYNPGPFASALLSEPVFFFYERSKFRDVKSNINQCWLEKKRYSDVDETAGKSLWTMLLDLSYQLENICVLPVPYDNLRLDQPIENLPIALESCTLRAFLINVRTGALEAKRYIEACYSLLIEASEKFWACQQTVENIERSRIKNKTADDMRERFKERRQQSRRFSAQVKLSLDRESLDFMGFNAMPSQADLRTRYISLAKMHHPDKETGNEDLFKQLTKAYKHLLQSY
ncbi:MAG: J domain-containing protein [Bdellovibrionota bacterium]